MNNFQFTQMGLNAGLATKNPYVAAIGTVGGFFGDLSLGRKRKLEADRNLMNSISQDAYNAQVAANPNPYTQDGGYEQAMSFSRGGTVKRFYGDGGPVGHVIPAERAGKAVADAAKAGIDLQKPASKTGHREGVISGDGHPKADDKLMMPGGQSIRVSSGEVYVDDDTMRRMAEAVGVGIGSYAKMMYPDTQHGDRFANGGPVSGNPPTTLERERLPFTPYALDTGDPYGLGVDVPRRLGPDLKPANGPREASLGLMKSKPVSFGGGSALPEPSARLKSAPMSGTTKSAPATASDGTGGMRKTNNIAFATNLALGTASLIYNAAQKGPVIPKPPAYEPEKVDLKTTALKAELDRRRVSGVATAGYALSNKQGLGRDLGLRSMDLSQRSQDALAVETVENQERSANTQIENQARLYNNQSLQRWMERDQEAQMNFRREKGDRMSMSLAGISDATSGWASGNQQIGAMGQMNDFNDRYLRYLSGNSETMQWDGSTIYFGDGTSTKRVERGVKLYDPQDYKYISNRFIR